MHEISGKRQDDTGKGHRKKSLVNVLSVRGLGLREKEMPDLHKVISWKDLPASQDGRSRPDNDAKYRISVRYPIEIKHQG